MTSEQSMNEEVSWPTTASLAMAALEVCHQSILLICGQVR